ncbi:2-hydroxyglutaryl-CoA dehydratase [Alkalicella caledoniensis]|uniref:2-hydroxyglutaryl-CoA dehydratase n=1 Tax=Alkalicella caledoniensis TaxID=2731377 RepID=A0A7G9WC02_ALKCA|nr:acyl-CoA dehydratase activase [Alkalicella caledoniensis]QNO16214.1 2-hydroxyglutaryl-CoA dehydratase [Alkalicella caledoniensis]
MSKGVYLGIDVGSVSTNVVLMDKDKNLLEKHYIRTHGRPIDAVKKGLESIKGFCSDKKVLGVGTTGSGRKLAAQMVGADVVKNEITAHAMAALSYNEKVQTVLEIGGQDSKIIILRDGIVTDFAMNSVCAAGTGSFLDQQASRLGIKIEEFGPLALKSNVELRIAGRCSVFAESDMIHKQQMGNHITDILAGLCTALVRNYLNNLGKGKDIQGPIMFQGGVAANPGIVKAFEKELNHKILIPEHFDVMGAYGSAILALLLEDKGSGSIFNGFGAVEDDFSPSSFICQDCGNGCEVVELYRNGAVNGTWGDRCGKYQNKIQQKTS